jgi:hypothetical protein
VNLRRRLRRDWLRSCGFTVTQTERLVTELRRIGVRGGRKPVTLLRAESRVRALVAREVLL